MEAVSLFKSALYVRADARLAQVGTLQHTTGEESSDMSMRGIASTHQPVGLKISLINFTKVFKKRAFKASVLQK